MSITFDKGQASLLPTLNSVDNINLQTMTALPTEDLPILWTKVFGLFLETGLAFSVDCLGLLHSAP